MLVKFVLLSFCCALINAKTLVRRDLRHVGVAGEQIESAKLPTSLKGIFRREGIEENTRLGASPLVQAGQDETGSNEEVDENDDDDDDEVEEEETNGSPDKQENTVKNEEIVKEDDDDDDEDEDEIDGNAEDDNKKEENNKESNNEIKEDVDETDSDEELSEEEDDDATGKNTPNIQSSYASVGMEHNPEKPFKFPKDQIDTFPAPQNPNNDQPSATGNFFNLQTLAKNLPTLNKFLPENKLEQTEEESTNELNDDSIIQQIAEFESVSETKNEKIEADDPSPNIHFDLDHDSVRNFISDSIPKNFGSFQNNLQGLGEMWQKIPKDFGSLQTKLQGLKDTWMNSMNQNFQPNIREEPKVGFGGWDKQQKAMFGNLTKYVNKAVEKARENLEENGRSIEAHNPPLTINLIPGTPVTFQLKRVEGAHTIDQHGQSRAIRYSKLYAFTQCKFTELRYYYDLIVRPMNLFGIRKSITVVLNDAPARMSLSIENSDNNNNNKEKTTSGKMTVMGLEFVNPDVTVETGTNRFSDYAINYLVNDMSPIVKQKLVEIVSRDSKLILVDYLKDSQ